MNEYGDGERLETEEAAPKGGRFRLAFLGEIMAVADLTSMRCTFFLDGVGFSGIVSSLKEGMSISLSFLRVALKSEPCPTKETKNKPAGIALPAHPSYNPDSILGASDSFPYKQNNSKTNNRAKVI